jgi:hypothetical protein
MYIMEIGPINTIRQTIEVREMITQRTENMMLSSHRYTASMENT